jgi:acyl-CoA thioesterase
MTRRLTIADVTIKVSMTEKALDKRFAAIVEKQDEPVSALLGMKVIEIKPGYARLGMKLKAEHMNFHGVAFGGIIMSLADQAFGYAVNTLSYPSVASQFNIYFLSSAGTGDELTAEGKVVKSGRRISVAEVSVTNQDGKLIARASGSTIAVTAE